MTVAVTRRELSASELRREAVRCRDVAAARRMLALALVLEGSSRETAARAAGMGRQTLRTGCTATTKKASPACATGPAPGASRGSRWRRPRIWRRPWSRGLSPIAMAWCAGGGWICACSGRR
jgi:hypothetical protein